MIETVIVLGVFEGVSWETVVYRDGNGLGSWREVRRAENNAAESRGDWKKEKRRLLSVKLQE